MKNLSIWAPPPYADDELFNPRSRLNRDNCLVPFHQLKAEVEKAGARCHTHDACLKLGIAPGVVLFLDIPARPVAGLPGMAGSAAAKWLFLMEPETIIPRNWDMRLHGQFDRIFTWNDELVDNRRYFKFNYPVVFDPAVKFDASRKEKLCTLIAGNHRSGHPLELYSKRVEVIRWFEKNHPGDFDFYGKGWDEYLFGGPKPVRALNRLHFLRKALAPSFPSWKGSVAEKNSVLSKYKFCVCYENIRGIKGYISEKIFDCFVSGCVPVYWGAENIQEHIPADCFLDQRVFPDYQAMHSFMKNMDDRVYSGYLGAISRFLAGPAAAKFSAAHFADLILRDLI